MKAIIQKELGLPVVEISDQTARLDGGDVLFTGISNADGWVVKTVTSTENVWKLLWCYRKRILCRDQWTDESRWCSGRGRRVPRISVHAREGIFFYFSSPVLFCLFVFFFFFACFVFTFSFSLMANTDHSVICPGKWSVTPQKFGLDGRSGHYLREPDKGCRRSFESK